MFIGDLSLFLSLSHSYSCNGQKGLFLDNVFTIQNGKLTMFCKWGLFTFGIILMMMLHRMCFVVQENCDALMRNFILKWDINMNTIQKISALSFFFLFFFLILGR